MSDNVFYDHLDVCERCREHPFNLCDKGAKLLGVAALGRTVNAASYLAQEMVAQKNMEMLHKQLIEQGYQPLGDGALADCYVKAEPKDGGLGCYDCKKACPSYMVNNDVWRLAFPDYAAVKQWLRKKYPKSGDQKERAKGIVQLCFPCLEERLGRKLTKGDFDLNFPINHGIALGIRMERKG